MVCVTHRMPSRVMRLCVALGLVMTTRLLSCATGSLVSAACAAQAAIPAAGATTIEIREGLAVAASRDRRTQFSADPIAAQVIAGTWVMPRPGDSIAFTPSQTQRWETIRAGADGSFSPPPTGGYLAATVNADQDRVMILEASGHMMVYAALEPRAGDVYATGYVKIPIKLHNGPNSLLFRTGGSRFKARLTTPAATAIINAGDVTVPDLIVNEPASVLAAVVVVNASPAWRDDLAITSMVPDGQQIRTRVPSLAPLSFQKIAFEINGPAPRSTGTCSLSLKLETRALKPSSEEWRTVDTASIKLRVRAASETHKRTFRSTIDGSVQYYAIVPALRAGAAAGQSRPGLVITLHGAAVEALGQAEAYAAKPGLHIVAPTNRRPYGFDWEDWGRLDAIEVLELAQRSLDTDSRKTYLTGHSMGGHGTWHLGVTFPGRFAAIAPSAGWVSMWSYAGSRRAGSPGPVEELLGRASNPSDTLALVRNLLATGVYVLHGDADDNVPVAQARRMRQALGEFHPDFAYHEQPGAGHWWGNACVDWPPLFAFLERRTLPLPGEVRRVDFTTASPGVSHRLHWASIEAQLKTLLPSAIHLEFDPAQRRFRGTTNNVARLVLDADQVLPHGKDQGPITIQLDSQMLPGIAVADARAATSIQIELVHSTGKWVVAKAPAPASWKGPRRMGPFQEAFRNRFILVTGTHGIAEENAATLARARYDAENFWYRGNGSVEIITDAMFIDPRRAEEYRDRNVIIYGHSENNCAWASLVGDSPVQVRRGAVSVGKRTLSGEDLACVFVRPRPGTDLASVGIVAGSGIAGLKLTAGLPYFVSGVEYPDCMVLDGRLAREGSAGIITAGYFGPDWGLESGEFAWRE